MKVINLTKHDVNYCDVYGNVIKTFKPCGIEARVRHGWETIEYVDGMPLVVRVDEHIVNLPDPQEDTLYIVSNIVLGWCTDRMDLIAPAKQCRDDETGRILGCCAFASNR